MRFTFPVKQSRAIYQDLLSVPTCNGVAVRGTSTESGRDFRWTIVRFLRLRSTRVTRKGAGCCTRAGISPHVLATFEPMLLQGDKSTNLLEGFGLTAINWRRSGIRSITFNGERNFIFRARPASRGKSSRSW